MTRPLTCTILLSLCILSSCTSSYSIVEENPSENSFNQWSSQDWQNPPKEYRPLVRWWWPGAHVEQEQLSTEISMLDDLGFGGIEIQPFTFGIPLTDSSNEQVRTVGSERFITLVDHALSEARVHNLRADLTMSSGWGMGGVLDCIECGTHQLLMSSIALDGPASINIELPKPSSAPYDSHPAANALGFAGGFDDELELVAVLLGKVLTRGIEGGKNNGENSVEIESLVNITDRIREGRFQSTLEDGQYQLFSIYRNLTNARLAGAAYQGNLEDFRTVDHLASKGLQAFRDNYFDAIANGLQQSPDHYFVDSFEFLADLPWTPRFHEAFVRIKGYDPTPFLPLFFLQGGDFSFNEGAQPRLMMDETAQRAREDYVDVRAELFQQQFIFPLRQTINKTGVQLRLQALGGYGDYLDVLSQADIPEVEDFTLEGNSEFLRLASSAAHVQGNRLASNEAFVGRLVPSSTGLSEDDYHALAGRAFANGLNQLVYHGYAYEFTLDSGSRWYPFESFNITTRLDDTNPIFNDLPRLNSTFARLSYAMTRGQHSSQVAWLMTHLRPAEFDQYENVAQDVNEHSVPPPYNELSPISGILRKTAIGYDRISRSALNTIARVCGKQACIGEATYDLILVDHAEVSSSDWLATLIKLADAGIPIVVFGEEPRRARGLANAGHRDDLIQQQLNMLKLLPAYHHVTEKEELSTLLAALTPDRSVQPINVQTWPFSSLVRFTDKEEYILIVNGTSEIQIGEMILSSSTAIEILNPENPDDTQELVLDENNTLSLTIPAKRYRVVRVIKSGQ